MQSTNPRFPQTRARINIPYGRGFRNTADLPTRQQIHTHTQLAPIHHIRYNHKIIIFVN